MKGATCGRRAGDTDACEKVAVAADVRDPNGVSVFWRALGARTFKKKKEAVIRVAARSEARKKKRGRRNLTHPAVFHDLRQPLDVRDEQTRKLGHRAGVEPRKGSGGPRPASPALRGADRGVACHAKRRREGIDRSPRTGARPRTCERRSGGRSVRKSGVVWAAFFGSRGLRDERCLRGSASETRRRSKEVKGDCFLPRKNRGQTRDFFLVPAPRSTQRARAWGGVIRRIVTALEDGGGPASTRWPTQKELSNGGGEKQTKLDRRHDNHRHRKKRGPAKLTAWPTRS